MEWPATQTVQPQELPSTGTAPHELRLHGALFARGAAEEELRFSELVGPIDRPRFGVLDAFVIKHAQCKKT